MCEFCNGKRQKIENGYTYGNAMIVGDTYKRHGFKVYWNENNNDGGQS